MQKPREKNKLFYGLGLVGVKSLSCHRMLHVDHDDDDSQN